MLELLAAWLLFPAALIVVSMGCGLLMERLTGVRLSGVLLAPTGLALVLVVARLLTELDTTAKFALPVLLLLAAGGLLLGWGRLREGRPDVWAAAAACGVFAVFGAPVFLSGEPTIAGSIVLPDTGNQLAIASFVSDHGHHWQQLATSSYQSVLRKYMVTAYPVAGQSAVGVLAPLGVIDLAWLYQPFLTFAAAMTSLGLYSLLTPVIGSRGPRALASFVAAQPALLMAYALQGSIKEVVGTSMLVLSAAHVARAVPASNSARALLPFALAVAAALGTLGAPAAAYSAPLVVGALVVWGVHAQRTRSRSQLLGLGAVLVLGAVAALPVLASARTGLNVADVALSRAGDLGNLPGPLAKRELSGIWMNGDYRYPPDGSDTAGWTLAAVMFAAAALGLLWMVRRRATEPLLLVGSLGLVSIPLAIKGSPYADAKVLAVASTVVVTSAAVGVWGMRGLWRGIPAIAMAAVIAGGVLLSNALAYHDSRHAPYDRYNELLRIDDRFAGQGPALLTEYDEYGSYLLRRVRGWVEPETSHLWRTPFLPTAPPRRPHVKAAFDVDALRLEYVERLPLLILRRSPVTSRPPANYRRVWHGHYYDVWRRDPRPRVRDHLPLGNGLLQPAAIPRCRTVRLMGDRARRLGGRLAYVAVPHLHELRPRVSKHPFYWEPYSGWPFAVIPVSQGEVEYAVMAPASARYVIWMEGSFGRAVSVFIDGRKIGQVAYRENNPGGHELVGSVSLRRGLHHIRLFSGGRDLRPGNGGSDSALRHLGPVVLSPPADEHRTVRYLDPSRAGRLCGRSLDWVEVIS